MADFGKAAGDALSGGIQGASAGASFGPWGSLAGGLGGLGLSALSSGLSSSLAHKGGWSQQPTRNPQQMQRSQWAGNTGMQQIQNPYQGFAPIAQNAISQYQNQVIPSLAERFSSLGNNALSSPSFGSQLQQGGNDLQERLAGLQAQYGLQQQSLGQSLFNMGQQPEFENVYTAGGPSGLSGFFGNLAPGLANYGMGELGNFNQQGGASQIISQIMQLLQGQGHTPGVAK